MNISPAYHIVCTTVMVLRQSIYIYLLLKSNFARNNRNPIKFSFQRQFDNVLFFRMKFDVWICYRFGLSHCVGCILLTPREKFFMSYPVPNYKYRQLHYVGVWYRYTQYIIIIQYTCVEGVQTILNVCRSINIMIIIII